METWDEDKLRKVVLSKHGNPRTTTDVRSNSLLISRISNNFQTDCLQILHRGYRNSKVSVSLHHTIFIRSHPHSPCSLPPYFFSKCLNCGAILINKIDSGGSGNVQTVERNVSIGTLFLLDSFSSRRRRHKRRLRRRIQLA